MQFSNLYSDVETICNVTNQRALVKRAVNRAQDKTFSFARWEFSLSDTFFATADDYSTGTVSVTNDSATVTGSGTTFTSSMVGRKFRIEGENAYYKIDAFVSATEITLEQNYQGDTASGETFSIFQDEYRLAGDLDLHHLLRSIEDSKALFEFTARDFDIFLPTPIASGTAHAMTPIGRRQSTYTTGTVSMSTGSATITGAATAWTSVQGLSKGNRIIIETQTFTILSVDSDTQLTAYESASSDISAGTSYTIVLDNPVVQLYRLPDETRNIYYRYYRRPAPLVNDTDEPEVPAAFQWLLVEGAKVEIWEHKGMIDRSTYAKSNFADGLTLMKQRYLSSIQNIPKKSQVVKMVRGDGVYPPNYGVGRALS